jgi:uncharacterized protein GlcG (DUF336 family)
MPAPRKVIAPRGVGAGTTADLADNSQPGGQFYGIQESNKGRVMIFAGGIPLKRDGQVVGAVGVSGGDGEQDTTVAEAAAAAFWSPDGVVSAVS